MIQINLLPWREDAKKRNQTKLAIFFAAFIGLIFIIVILLHIYFKHLADNQQKIITYLQTEITRQQTEITTLKEEKVQQEKVQVQLNFLLNLRKESFYVVRLFNKLVEIVPSTVTLDAIERQKDTFVITGTAQSELDITVFVKTLSQAALGQVTLTGMGLQETNGIQQRRFQLRIKQD